MWSSSQSPAVTTTGTVTHNDVGELLPTFAAAKLEKTSQNVDAKARGRDDRVMSIFWVVPNPNCVRPLHPLPTWV